MTSAFTTTLDLVEALGGNIMVMVNLSTQWLIAQKLHGTTKATPKGRTTDHNNQCQRVALHFLTKEKARSLKLQAEFSTFVKAKRRILIQS